MPYHSTRLVGTNSKSKTSSRSHGLVGNLCTWTHASTPTRYFGRAEPDWWNLTSYNKMMVPKYTSIPLARQRMYWLQHIPGSTTFWQKHLSTSVEVEKKKQKFWRFWQRQWRQTIMAVIMCLAAAIVVKMESGICD